MALFALLLVVQALGHVVSEDSIDDDVSISSGPVHDHHPHEESAVWFWFFLVLGVGVLVVFCLGVGWYGGSRRREYYVRHPDGTVLGVIETTSQSSAQPKKSSAKSRAALPF